VPEGDSLHRAARRLQALVGQRVEVETPHPRAAVKGLAERLDGRRLDGVEAVGKHLLLHFEGGLVLRSHLRMKGRWRLERRGVERVGKPWLVLRGDEHEAVLWNGAELELVGVRGAPRLEAGSAVGKAAGARLKSLGPDILGEPPDYETMVARLRVAPEREIGDALLDQRLVAGIGNLWRAEALWEARVSPWRRLGEVTDDELRTVLEAAQRLMRTALDRRRSPRQVYRRAGRPCPRCGATISSFPQGENARTAYWCSGCQK
jgi:endonuclease VIII